MNRAEAIKRFQRAKKILSIPNSDAAREIEAIDMAIEALQTDIVRCHECKFFSRSKDENNPWSLCTGRADRSIYVEPEDFCSGGRRKE